MSRRHVPAETAPASLFQAALAPRLAIVGALLVPLWLAILWATG